jgi:hypothetical protein
MVDLFRRKLLKTGAAATAIAAAKNAFAQQPAPAAGGSFFEKGPVRIHYQEAGRGFPLLLIAGGGLNSAITGLKNPFDCFGSSRASTGVLPQTCATRTRSVVGARRRRSTVGFPRR